MQSSSHTSKHARITKTCMMKKRAISSVVVESCDSSALSWIILMLTLIHRYSSKLPITCCYDYCNNTNAILFDSFRCDVCGKNSSTRARMQQHKKRHKTDHKPFICEHCGKGFLQKKNIQNHLLIQHRNLVPRFECEVCSKR